MGETPRQEGRAMIDIDALAATKQAPSQRIQLSEIALIGVYEISKILTAPTRLETTLANVLNLLSSFLQMRTEQLCFGR